MTEGSFYRSGEGEPLVAVHGIGSCWRVWDPILPELARHHDVYAPDLPGYGRCPPIDARPTVFAIGDALEQMLDDEGFETAHFVGNSLGGSIVAELAARGRARTAVVLAPGGLSLPRETTYAYFLLRLMYDSSCRLAPYADRLTASAVGRAFAFGLIAARPWRLDPDSAAYQLRAMAESPSFPETLRWLEEERPMPPDLTRIRCPFTVAWGTRDTLLPPRQAARWERVVPGARRVMLPGVGHGSMADDPDLIARTILETTTAGSSASAAEAA
jgi:pimeloyl-ACP methyl ester carboxylesterase